MVKIVCEVRSAYNRATTLYKDKYTPVIEEPKLVSKLEVNQTAKIL